MGIFDFISNLFTPVADLVDELHVSDEERGKLRNELARIQTDAQSKILEVEKARMEAMAKIQVAESNSKYRITAIWRPITTMGLVGLIIAGSFGLCEVKPEIFDLTSVFLGVYGTSRGLEKIAQTVKLGK